MPAVNASYSKGKWFGIIFKQHKFEKYLKGEEK